ncbi:MAG: hypothetical protein ACXWW4_00765 [Candidatus Binatia bacterium]
MDQFKKSRREYKESVNRQWGRLPDNDLVKAEADYDKFLEDMHKRCVNQKKEIERWAEDWCERGGWRNRSAHRD